MAPPWLTAATGPGLPTRPPRNARIRSPAVREDSPLLSTKSRSRAERSQSAKKASNVWLPSQFKRSRSRLSTCTVRSMAAAIAAAVSCVRRNGLP